MRFVIPLIVVGLLLVGCSSKAEIPTGSADGPSDVSVDDFVRIPISEVSSEMRKYSYDAEGIEVNFFVMKGKDGQIRTAFDACDVCGGYKGYRQVGDDVVCNNCGRYFKISDIGTKNRGGGCWPSYLSHQLEGDEILIRKSELAAGAFRFS